MSFASDWVTTYRADLGLLLQVRERLRARHRFLGPPGTANPPLLADPSAFEGSNSDLAAADVVAARAVLDALDADAALAAGEAALAKVAGTAGLPRV